MISTSTIRAVRELAIADVIGGYITLKKRGSNYLGTSPFSDEKTPSFTVFPRNNNFKCFSSGQQGDGIAFVMLYQNIEFIDAVREIANNHRIPIEEEKLTNEQLDDLKKAKEEKKDIAKAMEWAKNHFLNTDIPKQFLKDRKYTDDLATDFQLGYCDGGMHEMAIKAGYTEDILKKCGLVRALKQEGESVWIKVDSYIDRVIFPILDVKGNCIAFTGRTIKETSSDNPKYFNSPDSVWEKGSNLYGLYQAQDAIRKANKAYLVEGPTDVIAMFGWGINNTVSPCGSNLTNEQCRLLRRFTDNVCIVPDNDADKEKTSGKNPGMNALERNAILLLKHGFYVSVLIPGNEESKGDIDPDSFLRKIIHPDNVTNWLNNEERYIEDYLVKQCLVKSEFGAKEKAEAVKSMALVIESVQDNTLRGAYYDSVSKDWPYFKSHHKLEKRQSDASIPDIQKLQKEQREQLFENHFFVDNGAYWVYDNKNKKKISNFTFEALFCVFHADSSGSMDLKYVLKLISQFGRKRLAVISSDNFVSSPLFKKTVHRKHGFFWYGNDVQLDSIKNEKLLGIPEARELERVGWNDKHKFWVFSNGIFYDDSFHHIDEYGITVYSTKITSIDHFKKIPAESQIKIENTIYVLNEINEFIDKYGEDSLQMHIDRGDVHHMNFFYLPYGKAFRLNVSDDPSNPFKENSKYLVPKNKDDAWNFEQWSKKIMDIYPKNGILIIAYYIATVFIDIIFNSNIGYIPLLFMFGKRQSGKSTAARSIMWMFGKPPMDDGINLASGSTYTGMQRSMNSSVNHPFWGNEYKNSIHPKTIEALKGISDRGGKLTGTYTSGNETNIIKPRGSGIISGQDLPTQDPALLSRCLIQEYDSNTRGNYEDMQKFKRIENKGYFTLITCELLKYRHIIEEYYSKLEPEISSEILEILNSRFGGDVDRRSVLNIASVMTPIILLMRNSPIQFPFTIDELKEACIYSVKLTINIQQQSDEVEQYFHVLQSLVNMNKMHEDEHFKVKIESDGTKLYLRVSNIHGMYRQQARSEGVTALDQAVLFQYLKKHRTFIEVNTGSVYFNGKKTSAFVFDYDKLNEQGIELQRMNKSDNSSSNGHGQVNIKNILLDILNKKKDKELIDTSKLKIDLEIKSGQAIDDVKFRKLLKKANKELAQFRKEIIANDDSGLKIYIKSDVPF